MERLFIPSHLEKLRDAIERLGGEITLFDVKPPASAAEIDTTEHEIDRTLSPSLRRFFSEQAAAVDVFWTLETPARDFTGNFELSLSGLPADWLNWSGWRDAFESPADYDWPAEMNLTVYKAAFPLLSVMNGDQIILFDDDADGPGEVMYLDHEGTDCVFLGDSLDGFLDVWLRLGCPGPDFDELADFYDVDRQAISLETKGAKEWARALEKGFTR